MGDNEAVKYLEKGMNRIEKKLDSMLEHCEKQCTRISNNEKKIDKASTVMWVLSVLGSVALAGVAFLKNIIGLVS